MSIPRDSKWIESAQVCVLQSVFAGSPLDVGSNECQQLERSWKARQPDALVPMTLKVLNSLSQVLCDLYVFVLWFVTP